MKRSFARLCGWSIGLFALLLVPAIAIAVDELPRPGAAEPGWIATGPDGSEYSSELGSDDSTDGLDTPLAIDGHVVAIAPILLALGLAWRYWRRKQHRYLGRRGRDPPVSGIDAFDLRERPVTPCGDRHTLAATHGARELVRSHFSSASWPIPRSRGAAGCEQRERCNQPQEGQAHGAQGHGRSDPMIATEGGLQQ